MLTVILKDYSATWKASAERFDPSPNPLPIQPVLWLDESDTLTLALQSGCQMRETVSIPGPVNGSVVRRTVQRKLDGTVQVHDAVQFDGWTVSATYLQ